MAKTHPRFRRFSRAHLNDWHRDLVYRREAWVFRKLYGYWATAAQMHALNRALAEFFNVPMPRLYLRLSQDDKTGGWFKVWPDGRHNILVRGSKSTGTWETGALSNRCKHYRLWTRVHKGEYHVHTLLHEWGHYLAFKWWWHAGHTQTFCAVSEVTHAWYARRRKREVQRDVYWKEIDADAN